MRTSFISYALALASACPAPAIAKGLRNDKTNVLIIMTDEHNLRTLGCYRDLMSKDQAEIWGPGNVVETPHLDALAAKGVIALSAYAASPISAPTRSCFQTGLFSHNTGVPTNDQVMKRDLETFAEALGNKGYSTGYIGKWHLDGDGRPQWAPKDKFGWQDNRYMFNRGHWKKLEKTVDGARVGVVSPKGIPSYEVDGADEKSFTTDFLCDRAIEFMQANKEKPFCCMVSIPDPHGPNTVRKPYDTMYQHLNFKEPYTYNERGDHGQNGWEKTEGSFNSRQMQLYFGMVKCIDDNLGKLVHFLKEEGLYENTLIIFTSDHGDLCGEHHRHNKSVPYEMSARVPFVMHCPQLIDKKIVDKTAFSSVDFKPTLLGLLNVKAKKPSEGSDKSAYLLGKKIPEKKNVVFMRSATRPGAFEAGGDTTSRMSWVAAVTPRYKLIHTPNEGEVPWLIDLKKDPNELRNFYNDPAYARIIRRLSADLLEYGRSTDDKIIVRTKIEKELAAKMK
ncbi:MAG: sulfatase-like hydrolase/transferase [Parabacteroides gordonii]|uniref:sulfatase-like hydrolase/transferase n=1 Tax=Parabacteroides gordonii TaxID=574930 RepID=UPI003A896DC7